MSKRTKNHSIFGDCGTRKKEKRLEQIPPENNSSVYIVFCAELTYSNSIWMYLLSHNLICCQFRCHLASFCSHDIFVVLAIQFGYCISILL
jgi:hypothetical protein